VNLGLNSEKYDKAENLPETSVHCLKQNIKSSLKSTLGKKVMTILKMKHFRKIKKKNIVLKHRHMTY